MIIPADLKIKYLHRRTVDLEKLRKTLEGNDFSLAMKIGHQVKGNAKTFNFPSMADLGMEIEKAAVAQDKEKIRVLIHLMEKTIIRERVNVTP